MLSKSQQRYSKSNSAKVLSPIPENATVDSEGNTRIKVVVRVRPLTSREKGRGYKNIVHSNSDQTVTVWDPASFESKSVTELSQLDPKCWAKTFSFDRILWSMDREDPSYADQNAVFELLGQPVIDWVVQGYNCCVLAYGQTGTGKTYTMSGDMRGDPKEYGLVPRICFGLFDQLESQYVEGDEITVTFSHMEIYNENVRDLLAPGNTGNLRVREHPQQGVFVSNLKTIKVTTFEDVMSLIAIGDKNRTIAATNANAHSSRSHAIVNLTVIQRKRNAPKHGLPTSALQQKVGRVYLVDLAGSERVTFSGAKGDRLREANHINLSLSVLGDVIKSLGETKGGKRGHIPYRNSTLTLILKESLGGNSHAVMISAVSPCSMDYEETISTLKYADRAKRVRMHVEANITSGLLATDSSAVELVPLLQAEVRKLRELLNAQQQMQQAQQVPVSLSSSWDINGNRNDAQTSTVLLEMKERVRELEDQLADRERLIESLEILRSDQAMDAAESSLRESSDSFLGNSRQLNSLNSSLVNEAAVVQFKRSLSDSISNLTVSAAGHGAPSATLRVGAGGVDSDRESLNLNGGSMISARNTASEGNGSSTAPKVAHPVVVLAEDAVDTSLPRVINLNQDPLFSECLVYYLPEGTLMAGSKSAQADILLSGPDIVDKHCVVYQSRGQVRLLPLSGALVFVNGDLLTSYSAEIVAAFVASAGHQPIGRQLNHLDRLAFGRFHLFRFEGSGRNSQSKALSPNRSTNRGSGFDDSSERDARQDMSASPPGWEFAQEELLRKNDSIMSLRSSSELAPRQLFGDNNLSVNIVGHSGTSLTSHGATSRSPSGSTNRYQSSVGLPTGKSSPTSSTASNNGGVTGSRAVLSMTPKLSMTPTRFTSGNSASVHGSNQSQLPGSQQNGQGSGIVLPTTNQIAPTGHRPNTAVDSSGSNVESENDWWERLSKIAEGSEQAGPNELKVMLRGLVGRAEDRLLQRSTSAGTVTTATSSAARANSVSSSYYSTSANQSIDFGVDGSHYQFPISFEHITTNPTSSSVPESIVARAETPPPPPPAVVQTSSRSDYQRGSNADQIIAKPQGVSTSLNNPNSANPNAPEIETISTDLSPHEVFAREALALQEELAGMQKTLEERMLRYQKLVATGLPKK